MPRRNFVLMLGAALVSLVCYHTADRNPYGRYFMDVMDQIDRRYVDQVNDQELFQAAVQGMVSHLDDYSAYIGPEESSEFREAIGQQFGGVGIEISLDPKTNQLLVLSPIVDTPAYQAGIQAGDRIVQIDGKKTDGFTIKDAVALMRGKPGEPVTLTILRAGQTEPTVLKPIQRAVIHVSSVLGDTRNADGTWNYVLADHPEIGYLRITTFGEQTPDELDQALAKLHEQHITSLILDLRFNPGGLLESAVKVCDEFLPAGQPIVSTRGRDRQIRESWTGSGGKYLDLPLVVLINQYSASASEIVAACLQDDGRATIVGQRSFGKGTVQNVIPIEGGKSVLKLTTADYLRPSGKNIHRRKTAKETDEWGVMPNAADLVPLDDQAVETMLTWRRDRDYLGIRPAGDAKPLADKPPAVSGDVYQADPQLRRAMEVLMKQSARK